MFYKDIPNFKDFQLVPFYELKGDAKIVARMEILASQAKSIRKKKMAYKALSLNEKINNKTYFYIIINDLKWYKKISTDQKYFDDFIIQNLCPFSIYGQYITYFE